jgi:glycosyltransferase involved in cell wall biosynthesis
MAPAFYRLQALAREEPGVTNRPQVTVITPVYNEEEGLEAYHRSVTETLIRRDDCDYRILLVDDGSTDRSWELIQDICARFPRFHALRLSRNFGSHAAISAGIDHAGGDAVATLACDLQDPPSVILEFVEKWRHGAQIVWGHRRSRADNGWQAAASRVFFHLVRRYAMPRGSKFTTGSFLLLDQAVVEALRQFRELNRITFALVAWTGFKQDIVEYDRLARTRGVTGWTFARKLKAMYDTFIGFSELPARMITITGILMWIFSLLLGAYLLADYLIKSVLPGWTGIMLALTTFSGLLFLILGIIGEYLHRIYLEVTHRPIYLVSARAGFPPVEAAEAARPPVYLVSARAGPGGSEGAGR